MNFKIVSIIAICFGITACGTGGGSSQTNGGTTPDKLTNPATPTPIPPGVNLAQILISPGHGGVCSSPNMPCVSVTICEPQNLSNCDTIDNILVDTGSYGLRVFGSLLTNTRNSLPVMEQSGMQIAECVSYGDGTTNWGAVQYATVGLNGTYTVAPIPIQVLDASFPGMARNCPNADSTPATLGMNGIIGIGPWQTDEGVSNYYACNGSSCPTPVTPTTYVTNPVSQFPSGNNNGVTLVFGSVPGTGVVNADGYIVFGVGSANSNTPNTNSVNVFQIQIGISNIPINVNTTFGGATYSSFLDTGSNFLYFANSFLATCTDNIDFFCPSSDTPEVARMTGTDGVNPSSANISFTIGNADSLAATQNTAFSNIGGIFTGIGGIDWGLPFYLGRTVYTVFAGKTATLSDGTVLPASTSGYWIY